MINEKNVIQSIIKIEQLIIFLHIKNYIKTGILCLQFIIHIIIAKLQKDCKFIIKLKLWGFNAALCIIRVLTKIIK